MRRGGAQASQDPKTGHRFNEARREKKRLIRDERKGKSRRIQATAKSRGTLSYLCQGERVGEGCTDRTQLGEPYLRKRGIMGRSPVPRVTSAQRGGGLPERTSKGKKLLRRKVAPPSGTEGEKRILVGPEKTRAGAKGKKFFEQDATIKKDNSPSSEEGGAGNWSGAVISESPEKKSRYEEKGDRNQTLFEGGEEKITSQTREHCESSSTESKDVRESPEKELPGCRASRSSL